MSAITRVKQWRSLRRRRQQAVEPAWRGALPGEVEFWSRWIDTRGDQWPEDFARRLDPDLPLQPEIAAIADVAPGGLVRILDVGAGPLTFLGKRHPEFRVEITAVDALGDDYSRLLAAAGIDPPVRTLACESEQLSKVIAADSFDIAYARNTLDHSYDPVRAIREMIRCVRPGGRVLLVHRRDEAEEESYLGLHQWNFAIDGNDLTIWRPGTTVSLAEAVRQVAIVELTDAHDNWEFVTLRKRS